MKEKYEKVRQILLDLYHPSKMDVEEMKRKYNEYLKGIRKLAYKGYPEAQYDLAQHYEDIGIFGIPNPFENIVKKIYWYSKAASNKHALRVELFGESLRKKKSKNENVYL